MKKTSQSFTLMKFFRRNNFKKSDIDKRSNDFKK